MIWKPNTAPAQATLTLEADAAITAESNLEQALEELVSLKDKTIKSGWEKINVNSHQILFIVDPEGKILGSVSDGDVRRWVLADRSLNDPLAKIMNREPIVCSETDSRERIKLVMLKRSVNCVPILDRAGVIKKVVTWQSLIRGETAKAQKKTSSAKGTPTVIIAGGFGTRLAPFTKVLPKPLIPIGDKPILEHIMDRFQSFGADEFFLSLNYKANMIKAYFNEAGGDQKIHYVLEDKPLGTAGSLSLLKGKLLRDFFVSNCDILVDADYGDMLDFHHHNENAITMVCSMKHSRIPYGVVELNKGGTLKTLHEKPEYDHLVNTGMYIVSPAMLALVPNGTFFHFTDLIEKAKDLGHKIGVYPITEGAWVDIGQLEDYQAALSKLTA
ncbi:MAG: nucleotidyltransferase family protein [Fibrobacteres bacterium]|jgi:dTDP-glucose pyrophosphorylase|nr:nucleotidyltransferase family protein [Fibrobacterota bacterium]